MDKDTKTQTNGQRHKRTDKDISKRTKTQANGQI